MTTPTYITTSGGRISAFLIDNLREPGARPAAAPVLQAHGRSRTTTKSISLAGRCPRRQSLCLGRAEGETATAGREDSEPRTLRAEITEGE